MSKLAPRSINHIPNKKYRKGTHFEKPILKLREKFPRKENKNNSGMVPKPKHSIKKKLCSGLSALIDDIRAMYTIPQGNSPLSIPATKLPPGL